MNLLDNKRIAILTDHYYPSTNAGGPPRALWWAAQHASSLDVIVVTRNHDYLSRVPFPPPFVGVTQNGHVSVNYLPSLGRRSFRQWYRALTDTLGADVVWINSLHSKLFAVLPLLVLGTLGRSRPLLLSPRGELAPAAIAHNRLQKALWHALLKVLGIDRRVLWIASANPELDDIGRSFPEARRQLMPESSVLSGSELVAKPRSGPLRLLFLGRIVPIKGLAEGLEILAHVDEPTELTIAGPREDTDYAKRCEAIAERLPSHVRVHWMGPISSDSVPDVIRATDAMLAPSLSENFGHSIAESLSLGRPVFTTTGTPWASIGRSPAVILIPLDDPVAAARLIDDFAESSPERLVEIQQSAHQVGTAGIGGGSDLESIVRTVTEPGSNWLTKSLARRRLTRPA